MKVYEVKKLKIEREGALWILKAKEQKKYFATPNGLPKIEIELFVDDKDFSMKYKVKLLDKHGNPHRIFICEELVADLS